MRPDGSDEQAGVQLWVLGRSSAEEILSGLGSATCSPDTEQARITPDCTLLHAHRGDDDSHGGSGEPLLTGTAQRGSGWRRFSGRGSGRSATRLGVSEALSRLGPPGSMDVAIRVGEPEVALAVVTSARVAGRLERLWVLSEQLELLEAVRSDSPATRLLHLCDPARQPRGAEWHASQLRSMQIDGVMVPHQHVGAGLVALMGRFGRIVGADGAEHPRMVHASLRAGVDIVCGSPSAVLGTGGS